MEPGGFGLTRTMRTAGRWHAASGRCVCGLIRALREFGCRMPSTDSASAGRSSVTEASMQARRQARVKAGSL